MSRGGLRRGGRQVQRAAVGVDVGHAGNRRQVAGDARDAFVGARLSRARDDTLGVALGRDVGGDGTQVRGHGFS